MHRHHMTVMTILMHFLLHLDLQAVFQLQLQKGANDFEVSCGPRSHQSVSLSRSQIILNSLTH